MLWSTGRAGLATASYRELFAEPALRRLALADVCARLPQGMVSIALLLVAAQHASMTVAGLVVAGYTLGQAVTGPLRGRLADQRGLVPVATACTIGYAAALLALLASALSRGPAGLVIGTAVLAGLLNPPLSPGLDQLDHERRRGGRCRRGQRRHHLHPAAAPPAENPAGHARDRGSHPGSFG